MSHVKRTLAWLKRVASPNREHGSDWAFTIAIAVLALLPRLYVALVWAKEPVWDGHYYHFGATRIAEGLGYSEDVIRQGIRVWKPWTHYPVGYSAFLAIFYKLCGPHNWVAPVVNAVCGAGLVVVMHRLARLALGTFRGRLAAALTAVHPGLIAYSAVVMTEPLAALLLLLAASLIVRAPEKRLTLLLAGATLAAAVLVRPTTLLAIPLLIVLFPASFWHAVARTAVVGALCLLFVLPWTLRNCYRMDGCALVSTNAGWNLAIGALTDTGRFRTLRAADGCPVVTGQVQQDRCWWQIGVQAIKKDPKHFLSMATKKLAETFNHESFVIEYLHEADPAAWPDDIRQKGREWLSAAHRALIVMALFCVVAGVSLRRYKTLGFATQAVLSLALLALSKSAIDNDAHPYFWLITALCTLFWLPFPGRPERPRVLVFSVGFIALTALTHVAFFGEDRYHLVVTPLLCLCAAAAFGRANSVHQDSRKLSSGGTQEKVEVSRT